MKTYESAVFRCSIKACPQNFYKIYRKASAPESLFNKVVGVQLATLFKKNDSTQVFFNELSRFYRTGFLQNTVVGLLLRH